MSLNSFKLSSLLQLCFHHPLTRLVSGWLPSYCPSICLSCRRSSSVSHSRPSSSGWVRHLRLSDVCQDLSFHDRKPRSVPTLRSPGSQASSPLLRTSSASRSCFSGRLIADRIPCPTERLRVLIRPVAIRSCGIAAWSLRFARRVLHSLLEAVWVRLYYFLS